MAGGLGLVAPWPYTDLKPTSCQATWSDLASEVDSVPVSVEFD